jgi:hypothetical protein
MSRGRWYTMPFFCIELCHKFTLINVGTSRGGINIGF